MILLYHKICKLQHDYNYIGVTPENFKYQLEYIKRYYEIVPLSQVKGDQIAITFDDGFRDFYTEVYPYLMKQGVPATLFITTGKIGSQEELWTSELLRLIFAGNSHKRYFSMELPMFSYKFSVQSLADKIVVYRALKRICMKSEKNEIQNLLIQLRTWAGMHPEGREEYAFLTEQEIRQLAGCSLITIGAHTENHVSLGAFPREYQRGEIVRSKIELEKIIEEEIQYFSYPFGGKYDYNKETIGILKEEGFQRAYTAREQQGEDIMYEIPRIIVPNLGKGEFEKWFWNIVRKSGESCEIKSKEGNGKEIEYIGRLAGDESIIGGNKRLAIFGCGIRGEKLYEELKLYGKDIICFIDNDKKKQGNLIKDRLVISVGQIQHYELDAILIYSVWEKEMIEQLLKSGVRGIHWIVD